ncbi:hypothetical protein [Paraburkholderia sediminicola]|nr:hypothetical protein [Paraburkholderia sediminicola]
MQVVVKKPQTAGRKVAAVNGVEAENFRKIFDPFGVAKRFVVIA